MLKKPSIPNRRSLRNAQQVVSSNREELMFQLITVTLPEFYLDGWCLPGGWAGKIVGKAKGGKVVDI